MAKITKPKRPCPPALPACPRCQAQTILAIGREITQQAIYLRPPGPRMGDDEGDYRTNPLLAIPLGRWQWTCQACGHAWHRNSPAFTNSVHLLAATRAAVAAGNLEGAMAVLDVLGRHLAELHGIGNADQ